MVPCRVMIDYTTPRARTAARSLAIHCGVHRHHIARAYVTIARARGRRRAAGGGGGGFGGAAALVARRLWGVGGRRGGGGRAAAVYRDAFPREVVVMPLRALIITTVNALNRDHGEGTALHSLREYVSEAGSVAPSQDDVGDDDIPMMARFVENFADDSFEVRRSRHRDRASPTAIPSAV